MIPLAILLLGSLALVGQDPFLGWLDRVAQGQLDQREKAVASIRTVAAADARKALVRKKLNELIGGLPSFLYSGPLNARVTGRLQRDSYTIEKVIFESLPLGSGVRYVIGGVLFGLGWALAGF